LRRVDHPAAQSPAVSAGLFLRRGQARRHVPSAAASAVPIIVDLRQTTRKVG